ncbi:Uncharacterised protein [Candidatus Burarchaeum australiense]|nr:Uncharacterised protein [Candidatus Burarchaeum australiense]
MALSLVVNKDSNYSTERLQGFLEGGENFNRLLQDKDALGAALENDWTRERTVELILQRPAHEVGNGLVDVLENDGARRHAEAILLGMDRSYATRLLEFAAGGGNRTVATRAGELLMLLNIGRDSRAIPRNCMAPGPASAALASRTLYRVPG